MSPVRRNARCWLALAALAAACGQPPAPPEMTALPRLHPSVDDHPETRVTITTGSGAVTIPVKVAATRQRRAHGLMEVPRLPDGTGMLFVYDAPAQGSFYMLDTLVPLDIAFIGRDGRISAIFSMLPCDHEPCPPYGPDEPFVAALEVPQGWFDRVGVERGDRVSWGDIVPASP